MTRRKFRIFVLGAGFSKAAGLPLASELWPQIYERATFKYSTSSQFHRDLEDYRKYKFQCEGIDVAVDQINFEDFMRVLDIEHFLGLRGSDTWSVDGNEGTVITKTLIGEILTINTPPIARIPKLYLEFASQLQPDDYVLSFNYDTLLENALDAIDKPYRLFPNRYSSVTQGAGIVDDSKEEVVLLKMHGSINWFDRTHHLELEAERQRLGVTTPGPNHPVFCSQQPLSIARILDGPRHPGDPLDQMYRVLDIQELYRRDLFLSPPWMLTPSSVKLLYSNKLKDFWNGLGKAGILNFGLCIIGYSLPEHDEYARQVLYNLITNYQENYWDEEPLRNGLKKTPLVIADLFKTPEQLTKFKQRYRFVDWGKTILFQNGFDEEVLNKISS